MNGRVDAQSDRSANQSAADAAGALAVAVSASLATSLEPIDADDRWGTGPSLPSDHPAWMRDAISLSQRARTLLANVAPALVRVIAFWEHRARSIDLGGRTLMVDGSGSYRFER